MQKAIMSFHGTTTLKMKAKVHDFTWPKKGEKNKAMSREHRMHPSSIM